MTAINHAPPVVAGSGGALSLAMEGGVAVVTFDLPNEPVNKINRAVKDEITALLDRLERDERVRAVVLISGKPDVFIAGADVEEFLQLSGARDATRLSREGQAMLDRVERMRTPVVAAIHGACMGGGLEFALACAYRIGTDHAKTVLALPEVKLGLIPGVGGTQRLPRLIGLRNALDMILTGRNIRAKKALQIGLLDEVVHPAILREVAIGRARELGEGRLKRSTGRRAHGPADLVLEDNPVGRSLVFRQVRERTLRKTQGHYPAPFAAIEAVKAGYEHGRERGFAEEASLFGEMAATETSKQLIFLFFATNALKKDTGVEAAGIEPRRIEKIGVLGAGFMGAGIAAVAAMQNTTVHLKDASHDRIAKGMKGVWDVLQERYRKKQVTRQQFGDQYALVGGTVDYSGFGNIDLVVEAVFEEIGLKHRVLQETERVTPVDTIYASNTSTIPITRIAEAASRPGNVIGMHFFSPVHKMPLLEVIRAEDTTDETVAAVVAFGKKLGKTVIVVNDAPGFYANRILSPYVSEAGRLLDEGVAVDAIDRALTEFGFPVGPIKLIDEVGLDVAGKSGTVMFEAFGARMAPPDSFRRVIESGRTGRKGRRGFYRYGDGGKAQGVDESVYALLPTGTQRSTLTAEEIQRRTVLAMVNEAARTLEEGILRSPRDGDVGAVFGIGFPPFRGGPFRYVDTVGIETVVRQLEALHNRFAPRFEPAPILLDMARTGERFYPSEGKPV